VRAVARVFPVGVTRWRRQDRTQVGVVPDGLIVDRRQPHATSAAMVEDAPATRSAPRETSGAHGAIPAAGADPEP